jgi:hypothetical protein
VPVRSVPPAHGQPPVSRPPGALALAALALALVASGTGLVIADRAEAAVTRLHGFQATVDGWTTWYGSYGMGPIGTAWCIDHGIRAPDPAFGYQPTELPGLDDDTRTAVAWAVTRHGQGTDPLTHAALMLALHDLMGARYPSGHLDVDRLGTDRMAGFAGHEGSVLARARWIKADALARRDLRGPLVLAVETTEIAPGGEATATARLTDAGGRPVAGIAVHLEVSGGELAASGRSTSADGTATLPLRATGPVVEVTASATVPALVPAAFAPSTTRAQRVVRPGQVELRTTARAEQPSAGRLEVRKQGDAEPHLPVTGARFEVRDDEQAILGRLTIGADGTTEAIELAPGRYRLHETRPPEGYEAGGPWTVDVVAGRTTTRTVTNRARRGALEVAKLDAVTGEPVAGARIEVRRAGPDGAGELGEVVAEITSGDAPIEVTDLLPGPHLVVEVEAPPGYAGPGDARLVEVPAGGRATVALTNEPRSGVRFQKVPGDPHDPDALWLAGAVLVVSHPDGDELGRCTTGLDGRCALPPDALVGGSTACWAEVRAPAGWGEAEGDCFEAGPAGTVLDVEVHQPSRHATVVGAKHDAATGAPLAGATYDLWRMPPVPADAHPSGTGGPAGDDDEAARPPTDDPEPGDGDGEDPLGPPGPEPGDGEDPLGPPGPDPGPAGDRSAGPAGARWVGAATSDDAGRVRWAPQVPGWTYCATERVAPAGYGLDPTPRCTAGPLAELDHVLVPLPDVADLAPAEAGPAVEPEPAPPVSPTPTAPDTTPDTGFVAAPPPARSAPTHPTLPRTGGDPWAMALIGTGTCLLGLAGVGAVPRAGGTSRAGSPTRALRLPAGPPRGRRRSRARR